jgi:hypothetical protein
VQDERLLLRSKTEIQKTVLEKISTILLCNYEFAHHNTLRRPYARTCHEWQLKRPKTNAQILIARFPQPEEELNV